MPNPLSRCFARRKAPERGPGERFLSKAYYCPILAGPRLYIEGAISGVAVATFGVAEWIAED